MLDQLYKQGLSRIFVEIALAAVLKFGVSSARLHLDGSSMYVHGQYLKDEASSEPVPIEITHGYSRDHRPDLKQFTLNLITSGDGDVPLYLTVGNGDDADKAVFPEVIEQFKQQWRAAKPEVIAEVVTKPHYDKPGRPRKGDKPKRYTYLPKRR